MVTVNSDGNPISEDFEQAVSQAIVDYDLALVRPGGAAVGGEVRRVSLTLGSMAGQLGDAGFAPGEVGSATMEAKVAGASGLATGDDVEVRVGVLAGGAYEYVTVARLTVTSMSTAMGVATVKAVGPVQAKMAAPVGLGGGEHAAADVAAAIAAASGVEVEIGGFAVPDQMVHVSAGGTCRDALTALATRLGGRAHERGDGSVLVAPYSSVPTLALDPDVVTALPQLSDDDYAADGLTVTVREAGESGDGLAYTFGTGRVAVADPFATASTAAATWANLEGYSFAPGSVQVAVLDPRLTPFDVLSVEHEGRARLLPASSVTATYDGGWFGTVAASGLSAAAEAAKPKGPLAAFVTTAKTVVEEAVGVAKAFSQHFWDDADGAHVADVTRDEWQEQCQSPEPFSDVSADKPYHNSLWNGTGMLFRSALTNLVSITRSAIAFFDGQGNEESNVTAFFGAGGSRIGPADGLNAQVTPYSFSVNEPDRGAIAYMGMSYNGLSATETFALSHGGTDSGGRFVINDPVTWVDLKHEVTSIDEISVVAVTEDGSRIELAGTLLKDYYGDPDLSGNGKYSEDGVHRSDWEDAGGGDERFALERKSAMRSLGPGARGGHDAWYYSRVILPFDVAYAPEGWVSLEVTYAYRSDLPLYHMGPAGDDYCNLGPYSLSGGFESAARGPASLAFGLGATTTGDSSCGVALGRDSVSDNGGVALGWGLQSTYPFQAVVGAFNDYSDIHGKRFVVGGGWGYSDENRSNAFTVSDFGDAWAARDLQAGRDLSVAGSAAVGGTVSAAGAALSGDLTFSAGSICYKGSKSTYPMIKFKDNTSDIYGNGVVIGGGGATVIGGGESADAAWGTIDGGYGGAETMIVANDGDVQVWANCNGGASAAKKSYFRANGDFSSPGAVESLSGSLVLGPSATANSIAYGSTGPKVTFKNVNASQVGQLIYTDYDTVEVGASLTFVTNQSQSWLRSQYVRGTTQVCGSTTVMDASGVRIKSAATRGTTPGSATYRAFEVLDSADKRLAIWENGKLSDGTNVMNLWVLGDVAGTNSYGGIQIKKSVNNTSNSTAIFNANTGLFSAASFSGNGASLTSLNGSNIASGTVPYARLPVGTGASQVAQGSHTHSYLPLSGGTMTGAVNFNSRGACSVYNGPNDAANGVGGALNNLVINSWFGVSFTTACTGQTYTGKNAVSINCRNGNVYAAQYNGSGAGLTSLNASNVSSGTLALARGGTGTTGTGNPGNVFAAGANVSVTSFNIRTWGKACQLYVTLKANAAIAATATLLTINAGYRPAVQAWVGSSSAGEIGYITTDGILRSRSALTSGSTHYYFATYLLP